jgi:RNA polymerase sigma factor (TIGR02999 family)
MPARPSISSILSRASNGDRNAPVELMPLVYDELHRLAAGYMADERSNHTLQPTALVHEAWLRMVGDPREWKGRAHFLAACAAAMRRVLVDHARRRDADKRGSAGTRVALTGDSAAILRQDMQVLELNELLERLAVLDERKARGVELRFFAGMKREEVAEALHVSAATVDDDWVVARAWLAAEARRGEPR